jgi:mannosylfructose-phosphate synthase
MTAIEAMACGTPTVITTEGGLCHYVQWGVEALYANPNDPESFGHSICDVLAFPQVAEQLAEHGACKARARFTWTSVAQQFLNAAAGAISNQPSRRPTSTGGQRAWPAVTAVV